MATIDIDEAVGLLPEWDLTLTVGGEDYKTRPPTKFQIDVARRALGGGSREELARQLSTLLANAREADVLHWPDDVVAACLIEVVRHWEEARGKALAAPEPSPSKPA